MGYVETKAETRFSDFGPGGELHFSRCLMFFEMARFAISVDAGLKEGLMECYPGKGVSFVVIRVHNQYVKPVPLRYYFNGGLIVRSRLLETCSGKLSFEQELWGKDDQEGPYVKARIDTAMLLEGEGLLSRPDSRIIQRLDAYCERLERECWTLDTDRTEQG